MRAQLLLHFIICSLLLLDNLCYFFGLFPLFLTFPVCFASCNCCGFCGKFVREWLKGSEKKNKCTLFATQTTTLLHSNLYFQQFFFLFKLNKNKAKTNKKPILCNMGNRKNVKTNEFCIS